jgi:catechol 2,3-dioxygenase-like lactoylglutathione lyase family enzyme
MQLLDHVSITVASLKRVRRFYDAIMAALQVQMVYDREDAVGYGERNRAGSDGHSYFSLYQSAQSRPDARRHYCFRAQSADQVRSFHAAGSPRRHRCERTRPSAPLSRSLTSPRSSKTGGRSGRFTRRTLRVAFAAHAFAGQALLLHIAPPPGRKKSRRLTLRRPGAA